MSTSGFVVVRLDAPSPDELRGRAQAVTEWLLEAQILAPLRQSEWGFVEHALGEWGPGPRWRTAVNEPIPEAWRSSPGEEVDISAERRMHAALGNSVDFACLSCGTHLPSDEKFGDLIAEWLEHREPRVRCASCDHVALLGDWRSDYPPAVVGGPAVTFYRWPELRPDFVGQLTARLGGQRSRSFWSHF